MTVRLTVDRALWEAHVAATVDEVRPFADPVPVVKGNGYGFERTRLAAIAATFSNQICVGTVHELAGLPSGVDPVVLTPTLVGPSAAKAILTVANPDHIQALTATPHRVLVKLASSMRRYGGSTDLVTQARAAGLDVIGVSIHPPIAGSDDHHIDDILRHLPEIDPELEIWVSHLSPAAASSLPKDRKWKLRLGTALWHGERSALHLSCDVLDVRPVRAGEVAGYHQHAIHHDGNLVMVGAGTANGVHPLQDGRSPFHHRRTRLELVEPPHMHTSMLFCPAGLATPQVGDELDLQRPLTWTQIDDFTWT